VFAQLVASQVVLSSLELVSQLYFILLKQDQQLCDVWLDKYDILRIVLIILISSLCFIFTLFYEYMF
jgi:hypothetical protein